MTSRVFRTPLRRLGRLAALGATFGLLLATLLAVAPAQFGAGVAEAQVHPVVASGGYHTCVWMPDQTVWCWGDNFSGQLGNSGGNSPFPVKVAGLPAVSSVAAGHDNSCAIDTANNVWCWGANYDGQLGNGTTSVMSSKPVEATGIKAYQVSTGYGQTCAVTLTHTVECWGDNDYGELGDGTFTDSATPKLVTGLPPVNQVSAGDFHTCALTERDAMWCWGANTFGQLGDGSTKLSNKPVPVSGLDANVQLIAAGPQDTCAILIGGDLKCWGLNANGQLGNGGFTDQSTPDQVSGLTSGADQITLAEDFSCALIATPGAEVVCWGDASGEGELGTGQFNQVDPFPDVVFGLQSASIGNTITGPFQVSAGAQHACVVMDSNQLMCWGEGSRGQLGNGTLANRDIPTLVLGLPASATSANQVSVGGWTGCAITTALTTACWGEPTDVGPAETSAKVVTGLPGHTAEVSADYGACALQANSTVWCWGDNTYGQLGQGTAGGVSATPEQVKGLSGPLAGISTGGDDSCVLGTGGGVACWGANLYGQLGDGTTTERDSPVAVVGLPFPASQVSAGITMTCALIVDTTVQCWGDNNDGQLGNGSNSNSSKPVPVTGLSGVVQLATGPASACALTSGGGVYCWGDNLDGELGNGSSAKSSNVPVPVTGISTAVAIADGGGATCAILRGGTVECWGFGLDGALGDGSYKDSSTPVLVSMFASDGYSIGATSSAESLCALNQTEQANCWGFNKQGQLGDGSTANSATPEPVKGL